MPEFLFSRLINWKLTAAFQGKEVNCQLKTISQIIREQQIEQIDLLKIDVEKSEMDVLLGIEIEDWSKIKQVFVEVHDTGVSAFMKYILSPLLALRGGGWGWGSCTS